MIVIVMLFLLSIVMVAGARIFTHRPLSAADFICSAIDTSASR